MALTYNEFNKIVPKETVQFFDNLLPYLNFYLTRDMELDFHDIDTSAQHKDSKTFFLALYALSEFKEYSAFLGECGFKKTCYNIKMPSPSNNINPIKTDEIYEKFNYLIPAYDDKTLYQGLQPLDIILDAYKKYTNSCSHSVFDALFSTVGISTFKNKIINMNNAKKQEQEKEIEKNIFQNVPISIISHIEIASKIRTLLQKKISYNSTSICKDLDSDIVPLSLFLALYFDTNKDPNKNAIVCLLKEKGMTFDKISKAIGAAILESEIEQTSKNIYAIQEQYKKYYETENTINLNPTITIQGLVKNILNRNFTNSLVIEKLFAKLGFSVSDFGNIEEESRKAVTLQQKNKEQEAIKSFYKDVPKKTRDYLELTTKIYTYLTEKMVENKHNGDILSTDQDAVCLSLYLANHFFNGDVSVFFNDNGVKYDDILKLLKIEINKDEIDKRVVDKSILVNKFKALVFEGENRNTNSSKISMNDIGKNLCKREYTKTMILENIFNTLASTEIYESFLKEMNNHLIEKKKQEEIVLTQKLFHDMPVETIKILETSSRIYPKLLKNSKNLDRKTAQSISVLLTILEINNGEAKELLSSIGINKRDVLNYFSIDSRTLLSEPISIETLTNEFGELIFGLNNKERKREDLTPINICRNVFSKEFNNSVAMSKFLSTFDLTYDDVSDLDKLMSEVKEKQQREKREKAIYDKISNFPSETCKLMEESTKVHQILTKEKEKGKLDLSLIKTEEDFEVLSILIAMLSGKTKTKKTFEENKFTLSDLYKVLGLKSDVLYDIESISLDYDLLDDKYIKYIRGITNPSNTYINNLISHLMDNNELIEHASNVLNVNYERLEREVTTGKRFEETLTVDDRIKQLSTSPIEPLSADDMQSILEFGNGLLPHSKFIHGEVPGLIKDDKTEQSITHINQIIGEMYQEEKVESKQQGSFFSRLFQGEVEESRLVIDHSKIRDLKSVIDVNIERLKKELLQYDAVRRYIEGYIIKNRDYYQIAEQALGKISEKVADLDPNNDDDYAEYLTTNSFLQIVNDKATRFATVNLLMRKELLEVNQAIVGHFVTINSLEMARDDLIPLIESELMIAKGKESERQALDLSRNVMKLFQSLLSRNVEGTIENMNRLEQASIPQEVMTSINNDINTYIQGVSQIKFIEERIGSSKEEQTELKAPKQKK